jgi:hypothetical protein
LDEEPSVDFDVWVEPAFARTVRLQFGSGKKL